MPVSPGRFTLSTGVGDKLDLFFTDASGAVLQPISNGGQVIPVGRTKEALAVIIIYPGCASSKLSPSSNLQKGTQAIWSSNKYGKPILKISAFHAPCSFLDFD